MSPELPHQKLEGERGVSEGGGHDAGSLGRPWGRVKGVGGPLTLGGGEVISDDDSW